MSVPVAQSSALTAKEDVWRSLTRLKGKRSTMKRSKVMMQMMKADTSLESNDKNPAIYKIQQNLISLHLHEVVKVKDVEVSAFSGCFLFYMSLSY